MRGEVRRIGKDTISLSTVPKPQEKQGEWGGAKERGGSGREGEKIFHTPLWCVCMCESVWKESVREGNGRRCSWRGVR